MNLKCLGGIGLLVGLLAVGTGCDGGLSDPIDIEPGPNMNGMDPSQMAYYEQQYKDGAPPPSPYDSWESFYEA